MLNPKPLPGDLLYGVADIAAFLGVKTRQAHHLIDHGRLPIFREGRVICARRSVLHGWLAERGGAEARAS